MHLDKHETCFQHSPDKANGFYLSVVTTSIFEGPKNGELTKLSAQCILGGSASLSAKHLLSFYIIYINVQYIWMYGLPWHKVLNAVVAEQSIHKLKNQRRRIDSL